MKKRTFFNVSLWVLFLCVGNASLWAQNMPEVVSMREITLKTGVDPVNFHNLSDLGSEQIEELSRGMHAWLWKGNRGKRDGQYLHTYGFDLKATRDYYFPKEGEGSPKMNALGAKIQMPGNVSMGDFVEGTDVYTDYVVLGFESMVDPKGGAVVSLHEVEIPTEKQGAFEEFIITKMQPAWQEKVPGMYFYVMKGDRGERKGKYMAAIVFDTLERRNAYFPTADEGPSEELSAISEGMWFDAEIEALGVSNLGTEYTDYLIVY